MSDLLKKKEKRCKIAANAKELLIMCYFEINTAIIFA